jgi:undecaprenyl-diphosphatase
MALAPDPADDDAGERDPHGEQGPRGEHGDDGEHGESGEHGSHHHQHHLFDPDGAPVEAVLDIVDEVASGPPTGLSEALSAHVAGFDHAVDAWVDQNLRGRRAVDRFMYSITELGDFSLLWHLLSSTRGLVSDAEMRAAVRVSGVLAVESTVVNGGIKTMFRRERPVPDFERPHHLRVPMTTSFPSGHASAAFCAATLLSDGRSPLRRAGWYALAGTVAFSRVHVKIHHASDVLGGAAFGLVVGRIARRAWKLRH